MEKSKKSSKIIKLLLFFVYFVVVYVVALYYLFPYSKVADYLEIKLSKVAKADVEIKDLEFNVFSGVKLTGINVTKTLKNKGVNVLTINEFTLKPDYMSLFSETIRVSFGATVYDGNIDGVIQLSRTPAISPRSIDLKIANIDISKNPLINDLYNINTYGRLSGDISLRDIKKGLMHSNGRADISLSKGGVKGVVIKNLTVGFLPLDNESLPDISFDELKIELQKKTKLVNLKILSVEGADLNLSATGHLKLNKFLSRSSGNVDIKVNPADNYLSKNKTFTLLDKSMKSMKNSEGYYRIKAEGGVTRPKLSVFNPKTNKWQTL